MFFDKLRGRLGLVGFAFALRPLVSGAAPLGLPGPLRAMEVGWHLILPLPAPLFNWFFPSVCRTLLN